MSPAPGQGGGWVRLVVAAVAIVATRAPGLDARQGRRPVPPLPFRPLTRRTATLLLALVAVAVPRGTLWSDDVRPVQVQVREQEPGTYLVQWQVPDVLPPRAMPGPRLPDTCTPQGDRAVEAQPGAVLSRQVYRCAGGIGGSTIEMVYPFGNPSLSTVIRVELASGERYATLLPATETSWTVPEAPSVFAPLERVSAGVLHGVRHVVSSPVDLVLALALAAAGGLTLVGVFGLGQLGGAALGWAGLSLAPLLGELVLALATVLAARQALLPESHRRPVTGLLAAAGAAHGLAFATSAGGTGTAVLGVLGMDAVLLVGVVGIAALAARAPRTPRVAARVAGVMSVALGLGLWFGGTAVEADAPPVAAAPIPGPGTDGPSAPGASRRVSPQAPDAPVQSFLAIEAFEVRNEVLVRLRDVPEAVEVGPDATLPVQAQPRVLQRVADRVMASHILEVDGVAAQPFVERMAFMAVDPTGVLPRGEPVPESVADAYVGVTVTHVTPATPGRVVLTWTGFQGVGDVPTTVTDPEVSRAAVLTPDSPSLTWVNELAEDPVPTVAAVAVEPSRLPLPLLSLPLLLLALVLAWQGRREGAGSAGRLGARLVLAVALLVAPLGAVAVASPFGAAPSPEQARRILAGVLPNVYRAFEFRDEDAAYDRLAVSITGPTLTDIYLEHRQSLEMEERGGARARVEAVEVHEVSDVVPAREGGFDARASWSVSGTVTHFGHRHFRQNRYDARVAVVPVEDTWKIRTVDVLDERRVQ